MKISLIFKSLKAVSNEYAIQPIIDAVSKIPKVIFGKT